MSGNPEAQRIGKYEVQAQIAATRRTRVYRAIDPETRKAFALKMIPRAHLNAGALPAFRKYSQALARLEHPGISRYVDLIESEKAVVLVSEIPEGVPLSSLLKEGAHPDIKNVWDLARRMLETLAFAHSRGAVHRDLKPANVFLAASGAVTITDFGVAVLMAGSPDVLEYRAPEQFTPDAQITARTDIYQAGAIMYQLVTGKPPFSGTPEEIEHRIHQERPSDPSSYNNKIAWQLDWVVQKALSKDAIDRFNTPIDFAEGLRLGLQDTVGRPLDPITPPSPPAPAAGEASSPAAAPQPAKPAVPPPGSPVRQPTKPPVEAGPKGPAAAGAPVPPGAKAGSPNLAQKAQALAKAAPAPAATPAAPPAAETKGPARPRVLLVDDEERILNGVKALLRQDYEVVTALGGEAALAALRQGAFHVIVSDQRMPGITGVELLRQARTLAPNAVRMLLTGYTDLAALVGSINQGEIFKFVMKPWDNDELRKSVAEAARIGQELAATAPPTTPGGAPAKPANPRSAGSILVIDPKEGLAKGLERLLAGAAEVLLVPTPQEAGKVLQGREIAAIVADLGAGSDGLVALFRQLKEKRPEVLSILIAEEPDSELGIELINKAQIYRFLPKPVSAKELRTQVAAALRRYATIKQIKAGGKPSVATERARASPDRPVPGST